MTGKLGRALNETNAQLYGVAAPIPADAQSCNLPGYATRRATLREEAEKNAAYHGEMLQKLSAASDFLRDHPEFDEFVRLIRIGAIQI